MLTVGAKFVDARTNKNTLQMVLCELKFFSKRLNANMIIA